MSSFRLVSSLPVGAVLALAAFGIVGLLLGIAGDRKGMHALPDAVGSTVRVLHDPAASFAPGDVFSRPESDWEEWDGQGYIRALHREAVWVRVTLNNPADRPVRGVLADAEYYTDRIDLWTRDDTEPDGWRHQVSGEWIPASEKALWGRDAAFFVEVPARGERVVHLRLADHYGVWLRPVWWPDQRTFLSAQMRDVVSEACYFGVLLALLVYNAVIWARLRHRDLGYYLCYLSAVGLFMFFSRTAHQIVGLSIGSPVMETILTTALAVGGFFLVQFARTFLDLPRVTPRMDIAARAARIVMGSLVVSLVLLWSNHTLLLHITVAASSLTHLVLFIAAIAAWRAGSYYARYFVLSFGVLLGGILPTATIWLLAIPLGLSALAMRMGSALEMLLLSLALSDRFARLQSESLAARLAEEKARLELLRYQLNPHFLFNALNSVYGLVYPHSRGAGDLVRRLADFCRDTFAQRGDQWRTLAEEFAMLRTYLDIEQTRWRERLVVECAASPDVADVKLPAFLLLPLVENAIKHGGATSPDVLEVRVSARAADTDDAVEVEVSNTGRWQAPDEPREVSTHGIGMDNLRARLARNFPDAHRLDITSRDGRVSVLLRLPRHRTEP